MVPPSVTGLFDGWVAWVIIAGTLVLGLLYLAVMLNDWRKGRK